MVTTIGQILSRVIYQKIGEEQYEIDMTCGQCECCMTGFKIRETPTVAGAGEAVFCFSDRRREGISGKGCPGKIIHDGPEYWEFEILADIQQVTLSSD